MNSLTLRWVNVTSSLLKCFSLLLQVHNWTSGRTEVCFLLSGAASIVSSICQHCVIYRKWWRSLRMTQFTWLNSRKPSKQKWSNARKKTTSHGWELQQHWTLGLRTSSVWAELTDLRCGIWSVPCSGRGRGRRLYSQIIQRHLSHPRKDKLLCLTRVFVWWRGGLYWEMCGAVQDRAPYWHGGLSPAVAVQTWRGTQQDGLQVLSNTCHIHILYMFILSGQKGEGKKLCLCWIQ